MTRRFSNPSASGIWNCSEIAATLYSIPIFKRRRHRLSRFAILITLQAVLIVFHDLVDLPGIYGLEARSTDELAPESPASDQGFGFGSATRAASVRARG